MRLYQTAVPETRRKSPSHYAVDVRAHDSAAEDVERVADVTYGMAFEGLQGRLLVMRSLQPTTGPYLDVLPVLYPGYQYLQPTQPIMQDSLRNWYSKSSNAHKPNTPTREPKSVCGDTNVCPDGEVAGGALINRTVLPLRSSGLLSPARVPLGRPSLSSITLSMWKLTSIDFRTNGRTVESIAAPTVGG